MFILFTFEEIVDYEEIYFGPPGLDMFVLFICIYFQRRKINLSKFPKNVRSNSHILCCDIKSLYTSIPNDLGRLQAIEYWIDKLSYLIPNRFKKSFILEATRFVPYFKLYVFIYQTIINSEITNARSNYKDTTRWLLHIPEITNKKEKSITKSMPQGER